MGKKYRLIILIILVGLFFFLRFYHLKESVNFGADQGMTLLETHRVFKEKIITLISSTGSSWTANGRYIFFSSLIYYMLMPVLILFSWDPLSVSCFLILLQFVSLFLLYQIIAKTNYEMAVIFSLFYLVSPWMVEYSRFVWTPNFLVPLSGFALVILLAISRQKSHLFKYALAMGIVYGIGFQMHYSFTLVMAVSVIWLAKKKYFPPKNYLWLIVGFILMMLPLIIFELRHDFYNLRTVIYIIGAKSDNTQDQIFQFHPHYLLPLAPFVFYALALLVAWTKRINKYLPLLLMTAFVFYSFSKILPVPYSGYNMVYGWNYQGLQRMKEIILSQNPSNYNIVDVLTGDTRAMALRYLLTIQGNLPKEPTQYSDVSALFVYSRLPIEKILSGSLWEIDVIKPVKSLQSWQVQNDIYLYMIVPDRKRI